MAILKRGKTQSFRTKLRETVWPSMGWKRTFHYYRHRLFRTGDSTAAVTAGIATGAAISWTPFLGLHVVSTVFLCWLFRLNAIAGFIGTVIGNPWTYPFIFWLAYKVGVWLCSLFGLAGFIALPDDMALEHFVDAPITFLKYMFGHPQKLLLPLSVGGCVCGLLFWPIAYGLLFYPVRSARRAYRLQRMRHYKRLKEQGRAP